MECNTEGSVDTRIEPDWLNRYLGRFDMVQARMSMTAEMVKVSDYLPTHWVLRILLDFKVSPDTVSVEGYPVAIRQLYNLDLDIIRDELETALDEAYESLKATRLQELQIIEECRNTPHCDVESLKDAGGHVMRMEGKNFKFK